MKLPSEFSQAETIGWELEWNKRGCNKRGCKSKKHGNMQIWPNLREIGRICANCAQNLRKFAKLCLQNLRKFARNLRPRLLRYRLFLSDYLLRLRRPSAGSELSTSQTGVLEASPRADVLASSPLAIIGAGRHQSRQRPVETKMLAQFT